MKKRKIKKGPKIILILLICLILGIGIISLLPKEKEQKHLMEVFELRSREKSLILCSQMSSAEWHKKLGGGAIADAILDCACSKSYKLILSGESLRKISGIDTPF